MERDPRLLRAVEHPFGREIDERIDADGHPSDLKCEEMVSESIRIFFG